jgi:hypothetical protein
MWRGQSSNSQGDSSGRAEQGQDVKRYMQNYYKRHHKADETKRLYVMNKMLTDRKDVDINREYLLDVPIHSAPE